MSGPEIDLEKPNFLGGLDRLATNFALAMIAVVPTFLTAIVRPDRLRTLIDHDEPDGRKGVLLSPGAYFLLALLLSFIIAAMLSTPETLSYNGSYIGPDLAVAVQSAAAEGNIWKLIGTIMPIYGAAVVLGILGTMVAPIIRWLSARQTDWSLRVSVRAAFYVMGTLVSWIMLTTAIIDLIRVQGGITNLTRVYSFVIIPALGSVIWMYVGFFRGSGSLSWKQSIGLALAMVVLIILLMTSLDVLIRMF